MDTEKSLIAERAAEWLERIEHANAEERKQFVKWLKESPQHGWEILQLTSTDVVLRHLVQEAAIDIEALRTEADNVRPIADRELYASRPAPEQHRMWRPRRTISRTAWKAAAVVAFFAVLSLMTVGIQAISNRGISTAAGEWRDTRLPDGTILRAGPNTKLTIDMTDHQRLLRLARGEVMVHVAKDAARPFFIETELVTTRAIGTAFAVRHLQPDRVAVIVQEGVVAVNRGRAQDPAQSQRDLDRAVTVTAGHAVFVSSSSDVLVARPVDMRQELAWVEGRLIFGAESTVASAINELNLRNRRQIRLLDPAFGRRAMRGAFAISDPEAFARTLEKQFGVSVVEDDGVLLLVPRPSNANSHGDDLERR